MLTTINVTQEMINKGQRRDCSRCPVALAIREVVRPYLIVTVGFSGMFISYKSTNEGFVDEQKFNLNPEARSAINDFDNGFEMKPFSFNLDIKPELLRDAIPN